MEFKAVSKYIRISPRKTRLVADLVRGKNALYAQQLLASMNKRAARIINKTLFSALSNARQKEVDENKLRIERIFIDGGLLFKRYLPRAMGRATMVRKRTSHITIVLTDGNTEETKAPPETINVKTGTHDVEKKEVTKGKEEKKKPEKDIEKKPQKKRRGILNVRRKKEK